MDILKQLYTRMRLLCWVILCCIATPAIAQTNEGSTTDSTQRVATLFASPGVCELPDDGVSCTMEVSFIWEIPTPGEVCLWDSHQETPLQCWQDRWTATLTVPFTGGADRLFTLTRGLNGPIAARTTIKVMGAIEQRLRARRRQGFWRIF